MSASLFFGDRQLATVGQLASAMLFVGSALFWWRAATLNHPRCIDLGEIGGEGESQDWFWAYRRAARLSSYAAYLAGAGAATSAIATILA
jgi:hypothetical protein